MPPEASSPATGPQPRAEQQARRRAEPRAEPQVEQRDALRERAVSMGEPIRVEHNKPVWIDDSGQVWFVERGTVDVFLTQRDGDIPDRPLEHFVEAGAGRLVFGFDIDSDTGPSAVVKGVPGTVLRRLPLRQLCGLADDPDPHRHRHPHPNPDPDPDPDRHTDRDPDSNLDPGESSSRTEADNIAEEVIRQIDLWVVEFAASIVRGMAALPETRQRLRPGSVPRAGNLTADSGVLWLVDEARQGLFLDLASASPEGPGLLPMTTAAWVRLEPPGPGGDPSSQRAADQSSRQGADQRSQQGADQSTRRGADQSPQREADQSLRQEADQSPQQGADQSSRQGAVLSSRQVARKIGLDRLLTAVIPDFHAMAADAHELNRRMLRADTINQRASSAVWRREDALRARTGLYASVRHRRLPPEHRGPLVEAMRAVARHERIAIDVPETWRDDDRPPDLKEILDFSNLRRRRVRLELQDEWWLADCGALLGFLGEDRRPVALLPGRAGRYRAWDPATGKTVRLNRKRAGEIAKDAWQLYQPFTRDESGRGGLKQLLDVVTSGLAGDLARLGVTGLVSGLLNLLPAVAIGTLIERVIPGGASGPLLNVVLLLAGVAFIAALAHVLRGTAVMRIEARAAARITAALMDRVLRIRVGALRRFTTGELGLRVASFQLLRDRVAGTAVNALLSVMFLMPAFFIVFLYSVTLGWVVLGLGVLALIPISALAAAQVAPNHRCFEVSRKVGGDLFQFITGIGKLRAAGAEGVAMANWARLFSQEKRLDARVAELGEHIAAISASLPAIAAALIVGVYLLQGPEGPGVADFLVIFAVSMMFFNAIAVLGTAFESIATLAPTGDAVRPILAAELERTRPVRRSIRLRGELLFDRVSFRYESGGADVLTEVTIRAAPGDFIAIVGESGSGKSTLVRLALGLEEPTSGGVYYDGQDLALLNPEAVRRQIGVVTQGAELQPVSILKAIVGEMDDLTLEDAWRAARLARLDGDIAAMPMGMHTSIGENGCVLSGGQRQRLAVAAALVREPGIVILDEATSWLDSVTQEEVMANIAAVAVTRIVVAHRLSTTRNANRIYVLEAGRVVQEGTFEDLSVRAGPFRDLMHRQMA